MKTFVSGINTGWGNLRPTYYRRAGLLSSMLLLAGALQAGVWRVGDTSSHLPTPGALPVADIQSAIDLAQPGDRIELGVGEWSGNWHLPPGVTLVGAGAAQSLLRPADPARPLIAVSADTGLEGVALRGRLDSTAPLLIGQGGIVALKRVWISGTGSSNATPALRIEAGRIVMLFSTVAGCGVGLAVDRAAAGEVSHSLFAGCGVSIAPDSPVFVRHSVFEDVWPGIGNASMRADLKDLDAGDLHLTRSSPVRLFVPAMAVSAPEADGEPCIAALRGGDNWRLDPGADQFVDTDMDGMPSYWEQRHGLKAYSAADAASDPDGDGLSNLEEYDHGTHPLRADTDGDGLSDAQELDRGLNPNRPDTDGDGVADGMELWEYGSSPWLLDTDGDGLPDGFEIDWGLPVSFPAPTGADTDRDGYSDWAEYVLGSNPVDPLSPPTYWVRPGEMDTDSDLGDGSRHRPFAGIARALDSTTGPLVLRLNDGVYAEQVRLRAGIRMIGTARERVVLRGVGSGSVIEAREADFVRIEALTIEKGDSDRGGALFAERSNLRLMDLLIRSNKARQGGGIHLRECTGVVLEQILFMDNRAESGGGLCAEATLGIADGLRFVGNRAVEGGGFHGRFSDLGLRNCLFAENRATRGGGFWIQGGSQPLLHLTIADNRSTERGPAGIAVAGRVSAINCIVSGHFPPMSGPLEQAPGIVFDHVLTERPEELYGRNIFRGAPGYVGEAPRRFALGPGSPAIDRGRQTGQLATDWEGRPRTTDGNGDRKPVPDLGADEAVEMDPAYRASRPFQPSPRVEGSDAKAEMSVRVESIRWERDGVHIRWPTSKGAVYAVEFSVRGQDWELVSPIVEADTDGEFDWRDPRWRSPRNMPASGFYRVHRIPVASQGATRAD
ncbi:MAG: choice-of-anchor Q domain-containing protein [Verrucomicrobiota bacterium]